MRPAAVLNATMAATLMLLAWLPGTAAAALSATVEPRIVDEFDTVRLTIRATGSNQPASLDLEPLEPDFEVLTTQNSSQYRSVNGQVESWVEYQIMLRPRSSGDLTIPPIAVGADTTKPLLVRVRGVEPALREAIERMVFFETELTGNPVYVQSQTVLIRRLYYASGAQIYSDLPGVPQIPDAIVMPLGETSSTTTIRDGQRYGVIEQRFAILPEQSGTLTIPAISLTSSVRVQSDGRTRRTGVRVATEPMTLEVLPIPPEWPADHPWLPATSLTLSESWSPERRRVDVGDPIRRTLRAEVRGNVSSAIPPLDPALPEQHFRRYPEPPDLEDDDSGSSVRGIRQQAYSIIPTAPGTVNLPPIEVVWWDVRARQVRTARAPGRTVSIVGTAVQPTDPTADTAPAAPGTVPPVDLNLPLDAGPEPDAAQRQALWIVVLSLALAAALAVLLRGHLQRPAAAAQPGTERAARRALTAACRSGDPARIHETLLDYLRLHFGVPLPEAVRRFRRAGHGALLDRLNAARYRGTSAADVRGAEVLQAADSLRNPRAHRDRVPLPPLYD